jgi:hypothetical protein
MVGFDPNPESIAGRKGMLAVAKALGVGTSTVQRIAREIEAARPFDGVSGRRVKALA